MTRREVLRARLLNIVRRSDPTVVWTPDFMGFGNLLSIALWVDRDPQARRMMETDILKRWYSHFPSLESLAVPRSQVSFFARRQSAIDRHYAVEYADGEPANFVKRHLLPSFSQQPARGRLVVNVRRGDYFSDPAVRGYFGFDQEPYVRLAVEKVKANAEIAEIIVVSDGLDWCRARLDWLSEFAPVAYAENSTPAKDFETVATAESCVLTNSTFSYWAAHVHDVMFPSQERNVVIPRFFSRWSADHGITGHNPQWSVVEDIPGGWNA